MGLLNLTLIKENVSDEPEFITELLEVFKLDVFTDFQALQKSIQKSDYIGIRTDAHKVKSSLRSLGVEECWTRLQEIEDLGASGSEIERINVLSNEINKLLPRLKEEVDAYLKTPY